MTVNRELPVPRPGLPPGKHTARVRAMKRTDRYERQGWLPQRRQSSRDQGSLQLSMPMALEGREKRPRHRGCAAGGVRHGAPCLTVIDMGAPSAAGGRTAAREAAAAPSGALL